MITRKIVHEIGFLNKYKDIVGQIDPIRPLGKVVEVAGNVLFSKGPDARLSDICHIETTEDGDFVLAEVIGFKSDLVILSPLESISGVYPGSKVLSTGLPAQVALDESLLGRVIDGMGVPLDSQGRIYSTDVRDLENKPPGPLQRPMIHQPLSVGIKAIDGMLSIGKGQRIGIFSGSGVGKSTLMGMMARYGRADVNVIALIGERGREVLEFLRNELGEEGLQRSVVVVASSNESSMHRVRAAYMATTIAEYFRDLGNDVMLMMDSLTRFSMAQREVGLSAGEPAATKGYPPSVFGMMPVLLERAGNSEKGSITGIYTVLVEGDDMNDPIADAARGILDGHIVLSRDLAVRSHYPAIDVAESISRSMPNVVTKDHKDLAARVKELVAVYQENEEIIKLGAYVSGSNAKLDEAIVLIEKINEFLKQNVEEYYSFEESLQILKAIPEGLTQRVGSNLRRLS